MQISLIFNCLRHVPKYCWLAGGEQSVLRKKKGRFPRWGKWLIPAWPARNICSVFSFWNTLLKAIDWNLSHNFSDAAYANVTVAAGRWFSKWQLTPTAHLLKSIWSDWIRHVFTHYWEKTLKTLNKWNLHLIISKCWNLKWSEMRTSLI